MDIESARNLERIEMYLDETLKNHQVNERLLEIYRLSSQYNEETYKLLKHELNEIEENYNKLLFDLKNLKNGVKS